MFKCFDQELPSELKELLLKTLLLQMVDGDDHTFSTGSFMRMEEDGEEFVRTESAIVQANDRAIVLKNLFSFVSQRNRSIRLGCCGSE